MAAGAAGAGGSAGAGGAAGAGGSRPWSETDGWSGGKGATPWALNTFKGQTSQKERKLKGKNSRASQIPRWARPRRGKRKGK